MLPSKSSAGSERPSWPVHTLGSVCTPIAGDRTLSLLPPWHAYERATAYYVFSCGAASTRLTPPCIRMNIQDASVWS